MLKHARSSCKPVIRWTAFSIDTCSDVQGGGDYLPLRGGGCIRGERNNGSSTSNIILGRLAKVELHGELHGREAFVFVRPIKVWTSNTARPSSSSNMHVAVTTQIFLWRAIYWSIIHWKGLEWGAQSPFDGWEAGTVWFRRLSSVKSVLEAVLDDSSFSSYSSFFAIVTLHMVGSRNIYTIVTMLNNTTQIIIYMLNNTIQECFAGALDGRRSLA